MSRNHQEIIKESSITTFKVQMSQLRDRRRPCVTTTQHNTAQYISECRTTVLQKAGCTALTRCNTTDSNSQMAREEYHTIHGSGLVEQGESTRSEQAKGTNEITFWAHLRKALFPFSMLTSMTELPMYDNTNVPSITP